MSATTTATKLFGAPGASDPVMFHPGLVCIKRKFDFSVTPLDVSEDGADQAVFGIPKSFVAIGAFFESDKDANGNYPAAQGMTLKVADTVGGNDITIGAAFTPSNSAYKRQTLITGYSGAGESAAAVTVTGGPVAFDAVDSTTGRLDAFLALGATDRTQGVVTVGIIGFVPLGDGIENVVTPTARVVVQEHENVAGVDPWQEAHRSR